MKRFFSFFSGALMGGLVGAVVAILLAPYAGDELRAQIRSRAISMQDDVRSAAQTKRAELESQLASLRAPKPPAPPVEIE